MFVIGAGERPARSRRPGQNHKKLCRRAGDLCLFYSRMHNDDMEKQETKAGSK